MALSPAEAIRRKKRRQQEEDKQAARRSVSGDVDTGIDTPAFTVGLTSGFADAADPAPATAVPMAEAFEVFDGGASGGAGGGADFGSSSSDFGNSGGDFGNSGGGDFSGG